MAIELAVVDSRGHDVLGRPARHGPGMSSRTSSRAMVALPSGKWSVSEPPFGVTRRACSPCARWIPGELHSLEAGKPIPQQSSAETASIPMPY